MQRLLPSLRMRGRDSGLARLGWLVGLALAGVMPLCAAAPVIQNKPPQGASAASAAAAFERDLTTGYTSLQKGDLGAAQAAFERVLRAEPGHVNATLGLAEVALKRGDAQQAGTLLERLLAGAPDNADVLVAFGRFHSSHGRHAESLALLQKAVQQTPGHYSAHRDLGDLYLNGFKKPDDAIASYERAIQVRPDAVPPRVGIALAHLAADRKQLARAQLEQAARIAPKDAMLPHMIGRIDASERRFATAVVAMDRALALQPDLVPALSDRADIHAEMNQNAKAAADYERLLRLVPGNDVAKLKLGMVYQRLGRLDDARKVYLQSIDGKQGSAVAYNNLASIALQRNDDARQANAWALKAVALSPDTPHFHDTLGMSYRALGMKQQAVASLEKAARLGADQPDIHFHLGQAYEDAGRVADAIGAYKRALAAQPPFPHASRAKARIAALTR